MDEYLNDVNVQHESALKLADFNEKQLQNELEKVQTNTKDLEVQIKAINSLISGDQKIIDMTKSQIFQIEDIGKGSNCPTCTRPLLDEYDSVILSLEQIVIDTKKGANNTIKHIGIVKSGMINTGEKLSTIVDKANFTFAGRLL